MSILTGLTAVATPEMVRMIATVRLRFATSALADGLRLTRFEAIKNNGRAVMCKSSDGSQCSSQGDWAQGWMVFQDRNNDGKVDAGERILYREQPMMGSLRLTGNTMIKDYVSYTSFGRSETLSGAFQAGTFTVCTKSPDKSDAFTVVINNMGRPRVQKITVDHCD